MRNQRSIAELYNDLRADFRAGKDTRFQSRLAGVSSTGSGADYHYRNEVQWLHMMERARFYQRNDPIVGQGIRRVVANIVQDGFHLDVTTGDDSLNQDLRARWDAWANDPDMCHSEGELSFYQIEQLALSHTLIDGDMLLLPLRSGELQAIEAHRLRTPRNTTRNVVHGVLLDQRARRQEYWVTRENMDVNRAVIRVGEIQAFPARDGNGDRAVFHVYNPYRFSQRRGVTCVAPISDVVGMHDDIQFATLVKAQTAALIALFHERGPGYEPTGLAQKGVTEEEDIGGFTRTIEGISAGLEIFGGVDEKLQGFSPQIPSPGYVDHSMLVLTFIAVNLDLPVAVLLLDPSETNFSGWRGAIDQARLRFKQIQKWLSDSLHKRVYRWKVRQWLATDRALRALSQQQGIDIFGHRWNPPTFPYIEPEKDARADTLQQFNLLNSPRRIQASRGRDIDDIQREIVEDNTALITRAIEASKAVEQQTGVSVAWERFIGNPIKDGGSVDVPAVEPEQAPAVRPAAFNGRNRISVN